MHNSEKLKETVFFIEANSFEQLSLWRMYNESTKWEQDLSGFRLVIGHINGNKEMPVCVDFSFAKIHGKRICLYEAVSRFVDHTMVEDWIENNYPVKWDNNTRRGMTDAMNFHLAINRCKDEE